MLDRQQQQRVQALPVSTLLGANRGPVFAPPQRFFPRLGAICVTRHSSQGVCVSTWRSAGLTAPELVVPEALSGVFRAPRGSWLAHVTRELGEVVALRAPSTSGVVFPRPLLFFLGGWRGPSWSTAWVEKTLRPGGSREPLDPPYFCGSRTSLSKLSIPVLAALRARCDGGAPQHDSRSLLLACLASGLTCDLMNCPGLLGH